MQLERVTVDVPAGFAGVIEATAAGLRNAVLPSDEPARASEPDPAILDLIRAEFVEHASHPNPGRSLASKYGSRTGNWFVVYEGHHLPVKALFCAVKTRLGQVFWESPADFHTSLAVDFFNEVGFKVVTK